MAKLMKIHIVTPEKTIFDGDIRELTAAGIDGEFGILPEHAPFVTILAPGVVSVKMADGRTDELAVSGGYIEVTGDHVILLVESAEREGEVDIDTIKRRKEEKEKLLKVRNVKDVDFDRIQIELIREISRLKAVETLKRRKGR